MPCGYVAENINSVRKIFWM